jgi:hypothetical protein
VKLIIAICFIDLFMPCASINPFFMKIDPWKFGQKQFTIEKFRILPKQNSPFHQFLIQNLQIRFICVCFILIKIRLKYHSFQQKMLSVPAINLQNSVHIYYKRSLMEKYFSLTWVSQQSRFDIIINIEIEPIYCRKKGQWIVCIIDLTGRLLSRLVLAQSSHE